MNPNPALPPPPVRRQVSGISLVAEVTLRRYFTGQIVKPSSRHRIEAALRELGVPQFIRAPEVPLPGVAASDPEEG